MGKKNEKYNNAHLELLDCVIPFLGVVLLNMSCNNPYLSPLFSAAASALFRDEFWNYG